MNDRPNDRDSDLVDSSGAGSLVDVSSKEVSAGQSTESVKKPRMYIAGPMRGIKDHNYPAFNAAEEKLTEQGEWCPINPAALDEEAGIEPGADFEPFIRSALARDLEAIANRADAVGVLPGWRESKGALAEVALAQAIGMPVYSLHPGLDRPAPIQPFLTASPASPKEDRTTALDKAKKLVYGDRNESYGHPYEDFNRTAKIWEALLGTSVTPQQVAMCMVGVKLSRHVHRPKPDNIVDICGYAECLKRVEDREQGIE